MAVWNCLSRLANVIVAMLLWRLHLLDRWTTVWKRKLFSCLMVWGTVIVALSFTPETSKHNSPTPKQIDNWGSRPVFGKDWRESVSCCDGAIDACYQIFAKSWLTSGKGCLHSILYLDECIIHIPLIASSAVDFCTTEDLSAKYPIAFDEE